MEKLRFEIMEIMKNYGKYMLKKNAKEKLYASKTFLKMGGGRMYAPGSHPTP